MADETLDLNETASRPKKERSPSFPFISLRKAIERAESLYAGHRREPARLVAVAPTWGYGAKSSGLLQTVAALKQFGLVDDLGSGEDRKIQITDLARLILADQRPGAREKAVKEAAKLPKLIAEYIEKWVPDRPTDSHCISELHLDRGFTADAARAFLKIFDETVAYAGLGEERADLESVDDPDTFEADGELHRDGPSMIRERSALDGGRATSRPLSERLEITMNGRTLAGVFTLTSSDEVDTVIRILEANKGVLKALEDVANVPKPEC